VCGGCGCSVKPATVCSDSDSKYTAVPDNGIDGGLSLSMVCDEEIISTDTNSKHCISVSATSKPCSGEKPRLSEKLSPVGKASSRKVKSVCLSRFELEGLEAVVSWLEELPLGKRNVPKDILAPDILLSDMRVSRLSLFLDPEVGSQNVTLVVILVVVVVSSLKIPKA